MDDGDAVIGGVEDHHSQGGGSRQAGRELQGPGDADHDEEGDRGQDEVEENGERHFPVAGFEDEQAVEHEDRDEDIEVQFGKGVEVNGEKFRQGVTQGHDDEDGQYDVEGDVEKEQGDPFKGQDGLRGFILQDERPRFGRNIYLQMGLSDGLYFESRMNFRHQLTQKNAFPESISRFFADILCHTTVRERRNPKAIDSQIN